MNSNDFDNNVEMKTFSDLDRVDVIDFKNDFEYRARSISSDLFKIYRRSLSTIILIDRCYDRSKIT